MSSEREPTGILVVFTTTVGNTGRMARSVADGARSVPGTSVTLKDAEEATAEGGRGCDCLILGSPVRHRSADARVKGFIERVLEQLWLADEMVGKIGGVFTVGGGYGGAGAGCDVAQVGMLAAPVVHGEAVLPSRGLVEQVPAELVDDQDAVQQPPKLVETVVEVVDVMERERGDDRIEGAWLLELLDRRPAEDRAVGRLGVDSHDLVAGGVERESQLAVPAADLEHAARRRRQ